MRQSVTYVPATPYLRFVHCLFSSKLCNDFNGLEYLYQKRYNNDFNGLAVLHRYRYRQPPAVQHMCAGFSRSAA